MKIFLLLLIVSFSLADSSTFYLDESSQDPDPTCPQANPCSNLTEVYTAIVNQGNPNSTIIVAEGTYDPGNVGTPDAVMYFLGSTTAESSFLPSHNQDFCFLPSQSVSFSYINFYDCSNAIKYVGSQSDSFLHLDNVEFINCNISVLSDPGFDSIEIESSDSVSLITSNATTIHLSDTVFDRVSVEIIRDLVHGEISSGTFGDDVLVVRHDSSDIMFEFNEGKFEVTSSVTLSGGSYSFTETDFSGDVSILAGTKQVDFSDLTFELLSLEANLLGNDEHLTVNIEGVALSLATVSLINVYSLTVNETTFSEVDLEITEMAALTFIDVEMEDCSSSIEATTGLIQEGSFTNQNMEISGDSWEINGITVDGNKNENPSFTINEAQIVLSDSRFNGSTSGALSLERVDFVVSETNFTHNSAVSGAAIYGLDLTSFRSEDCYYEHNVASQLGGSIQFDVTDVRLDDGETPSEEASGDDHGETEHKKARKQVLSSNEPSTPNVDSAGLGKSDPAYTAIFENAVFSYNSATSGAAISCCTPEAQEYCVLVEFDKGDIHTFNNINSVGEEGTDISCIQGVIPEGEEYTGEEHEEEEYDALHDPVLWTLVGMNVVLILVLLSAGVVIFYFSRQKANYQLLV